MELKFLEIFCKVVEERSFSKTADALHLTQPTISSHIKAIEDEAGIQLLDRLGRSVIPTKAGEILYKYAKEILNTKNSAIQALNQFKGAARGSLIIGGSTIPGEYILPEYIARFKKTHPEVLITLKIGDSQDIVDMVSNGSIEMGVIGSKPNNARFDFREFLKDKLVLVASQGHFKHIKKEISVKELKELPFIIREKGSGTRKSMEGYLKENRIYPDDLNIVAEVASTEAVKQSVKTGIGTAFLSEFAVKSELPYKILRKINVRGLDITRHFYIITDRLRAVSPVCQTFIKSLSAVKF
ncbi:MAG: hypothetical protein A2073_03790 [Deltaproteobacteria bacterium GWC2_42_11]|nr:MAG: hypothetical protein A2073_03790 [Deltaproteobacteria bacterium GWC2_42_11]